MLAIKKYFFSVSLIVCAMFLLVSPAFAAQQYVRLDKRKVEPCRFPTRFFYKSSHRATVKSKFLSFPLVLAFMFLLFASAFMPCRVLAGQNIVIDSTVSHNVFGNGNAADNGSAPDPANQGSLVNPPNDNIVTLNNGAMVNGNVTGGYIDSISDPITASGNSVIINSGIVSGYVFGGRAINDYGLTTVSGNSVAVSGGTVNYDVYGGYVISHSGSVIVSGNGVTISGGTVNNTIMGGIAYSNSSSLIEATGNSVTISDGMVNNSVTGGYATSDSGSVMASGNSVTISGGTVGNTVIGGLAYGNSSSLVEVSGNSVTISDGMVKSSVTGGSATNNSGSVIAYGNSVTISGGTVGNTVMGGLAYGNNSSLVEVTGNSVTISDGMVNGSVTGGYAINSSGSVIAYGNSVTISGGTINNIVMGVRAYSQHDSVTALDNSVVVSDGIVNSSVTGGEATSNSGSVMVSGNSAIISGGTVNDTVMGGQAYGSNSSLVEVTGNSVTISDGMVNNSVTGGYAINSSGSVIASGNSVTISGGTANVNVMGGYATSYNSSLIEATGNSVTISGGTVGNVYGGYSLSGLPISVGNAIGSATGNTVTLSGMPTLTTSNLYGGFVSSLEPGDAFSGNTLNICNYSGSMVASIQNFENYNFVFPAKQSGPVLEVSGTTFLGDGTRGSIVTINTLDSPSSLQIGDSVTLISGIIATNGFNQTTAVMIHGTMLRYNWRLDVSSGSALIATLDNVEVNPQAKALSEGWLSGIVIVNQGADAVAGPGMASAVLAAQNTDNAFAMFGSLYGGQSRYNTGSHADVSGVLLLTGLSFSTDLTPGRLTLGAFFEYGNGSYDTHNSFSTAAAVNGNGDIDYLGGGILGRMDFAKTGPGNFYAEATGRTGKIHNEYDGSDLRDATGRKIEYDASSIYYSLHLGAGYIWNITEAVSLDLYGKYFWTRQEGDSVTLSTGDRVKFKNSDSHRLRLGSRFTYAVNEYVSPYVGVAWEHEFDGKVRATSYSYPIDAPSLRGDTGIGELGITLTPKPSIPLSLDLEVQGYMGQREGVTGALRIKYEF